MMQRHPRVHDPKHLQFIRWLPCVVCGENTTVEAAHIRFACREVGKYFTGWGKCDDKWTVPLCGAHHRDQHAMNEREFWDEAGIDPIVIAQRLFACAGNVELGERVVGSARLAA